MKTASDYRAAARESLDEQWHSSALMTLIILVLASIFSVSPMLFADNIQRTLLADSAGTLMSILLVGPLEYAMFNVILLINRQRLEDVPVIAMFKDGIADWGRYVVALVLQMIIITLISIPTLGIGGIIFAYAYKMVPFLLHDYPELTAKEALKLSREMMKGYKWELFVLDLTFIGWALLCILTLGIGVLWLAPYIYSAEAHFYDDLKAEVVVEE